MKEEIRLLCFLILFLFLIFCNKFLLCALAGLELAMQKSTCVCVLNTSVKGVHHHTQPDLPDFSH